MSSAVWTALTIAASVFGLYVMAGGIQLIVTRRYPRPVSWWRPYRTAQEPRLQGWSLTLLGLGLLLTLATVARWVDGDGARTVVAALAAASVTASVVVGLLARRAARRGDDPP